MASSFAGFSEEDLVRIKLGEIEDKKEIQRNVSNFKKLDKVGAKPKRYSNHYKSPALKRLDSDDFTDNIEFDNCKLSIKTPTSALEDVVKSNDKENKNMNSSYTQIVLHKEDSNEIKEDGNEIVKDILEQNNNLNVDSRKSSTDIAPDIIRSVDNYTEDDQVAHVVKLEELQLKQKLMEEQNKKRKEMLAKALADRTKQTEEEVMKLEKIKKELHILDGQFSQDVAVLRKKIDQACLSYAEAEKHYLRIEKEFLLAKINLQKEKEKKELLTEHLCALITHNEMRKAKKLETLMLELASDRKANNIKDSPVPVDDETPVVVDGVDERTGKIMELNE